MAKEQGIVKYTQIVMLFLLEALGLQLKGNKYLNSSPAEIVQRSGHVAALPKEDFFLPSVITELWLRLYELPCTGPYSLRCRGGGAARFSLILIIPIVSGTVTQGQ